MSEALFADRVDAGCRLAIRLEGLAADHPVVLALPRGGVPVANEIAEALQADLDVLMVRKIGVPWQPELALAAVVDGSPPETVINDEVAALVPVAPDTLRQQTALQTAEIERRRRLYRGDRPPLSVEGRVVILVDDGIATGTTVRAALRGLRKRRPARIVLAIPVAAASTLARLKAEADEVVCLSVPSHFLAVGAHYVNFDQVDDDEVARILSAHAARDGLGVGESRAHHDGTTT